MVADILEVAGHDADGLVDALAEVADALRIFRQLRLLPSIKSGAEECDESGGRSDDDLLLDAMLNEAGILLQRGAEEDFSGQEHDDEFGRRSELVPVALGAELVDVIANLAGVGGHARAAGIFVGCLNGVEIGGERRLGVDDDGLAAGEPNNEIGTQAAVCGVDPGLLQEVSVVDHAGHLDDAAKLELSPAATDVGSTKGLDELAGFRLELLLRADDGLELFV